MLTHGLAISCASSAMLVSMEDAEHLVREINRTEALMPILDPTGWQRIAKTEQDHLRIAQAFLEFRRALNYVEHHRT
jgi:hypothetical protein